MAISKKLDGFAKCAWLVLVWNLVVILWGVFLRASKSGDGCGQHWLTCQGEILPSAPQLKTLIEYSHRITSFLAFMSVLALLIWTLRRYGKGNPIRTTVLWSFVFVVTEALIGAGLVLTGNTAETLTAARPFWMAGHLINTFILIAFLTLTARAASGGKRPVFQSTRSHRTVIIIGVLAVFIVGITGSLAALANMLFPSGTLAEGMAKDFSSTSNILLRLRLLHPITAILVSVVLVFLTGWLSKRSENDAGVKRWSVVVSGLVLAQIAFGAATLLLLAPIVMQLGHLLLADLMWMAYVMTAANFLSIERSRFAAPFKATFDEVVE